MRVLSCNVGSTSLKYRLYSLGSEEREVASGHFEGVARAKGKSRHASAAGMTRESGAPAESYGRAITDMLDFLRDSGALPQGSLPGCVVFKTVAALGYSGVQLLGEPVLEGMEKLYALLPAHNPPYAAAIRQFARLMPGLPLIGCFETGFFDGMKDEASLYALPLELARQGLRRRGAHGASHEYVTEWVSAREGKDDLRLISCHLGGSSSIAAVKDGRGADTSIGLSMQTGLPHNNRCGDIDPYLVFYLHESLGWSLESIKAMLSQRSGLLGLSGGLSADYRELEQAADEGNAKARTAVNVFAYQIRKQIGAFAAALGGIDAVAFTGGIGQNSAALRAQALEGLDFMGIQLDVEKNNNAREDGLLSAADSPVRVYRVTTNEELIIARKARAFLEKGAKQENLL